jgi:sugar phosphate isomerase/epimerase
MDRREMLKRLAVAGVAPWAYTIFDPAAPAVWRLPMPRVGIQLYSVRSLLAKDFEGTLKALGAIGYREVEFAGWYNRTPDQIKRAVSDAGLTAPAAHVDLMAFRRDAAKLVAEHAAAGHRNVVVAWMPPGERTTLDDWKRRAEEFNRFGEAARNGGLSFAYHNHDFEFKPVEGQVPFEVLAAGTDPELVRLELDLYWATLAGADPLAWFRRWPGRVTMVHVKDRDAAGRMVDVGAGTLPFDPMLKAARKLGLQHAFIEHDNPTDPMAFAQASYTWLKGRDVWS